MPPEGIQRVEREQGDRVNVWPHLLIEEFVAMFVLSVGLVVFSTFLNAPLRELANPNLTPNPRRLRGTSSGSRSSCATST